MVLLLVSCSSGSVADGSGAEDEATVAIELGTLVLHGSIETAGLRDPRVQVDGQTADLDGDHWRVRVDMPSLPAVIEVALYDGERLQGTRLLELEP